MGRGNDYNSAPRTGRHKYILLHSGHPGHEWVKTANKSTARAHAKRVFIAEDVESMDGFYVVDHQGETIARYSHRDAAGRHFWVNVSPRGEQVTCRHKDLIDFLVALGAPPADIQRFIESKFNNELGFRISADTVIEWIEESAQDYFMANC